VYLHPDYGYGRLLAIEKNTDWNVMKGLQPVGIEICTLSIGYGGVTGIWRDSVEQVDGDGTELIDNGVRRYLDAERYGRTVRRQIAATSGSRPILDNDGRPHQAVGLPHWLDSIKIFGNWSVVGAPIKGFKGAQ